MFGINNNPAPIQGPTPTFGRSNNTQQVSDNNQGQVNSFGTSDSFNVDNTSKSFDQAMARFTGKPVSFDQPQQPQMTQSSGNQPLPQGISQQEIDWAMSLEAKVKQGYQPTPQEAQAYKALENKLANVATSPSTSSPAPAAQAMPISQDELKWALELEAKAKQGYQPTQQEKDTYNALAQKLSQAKTSPSTQTTPPALQVTQEEIKWALEMEEKVKQGYKPTEQEVQTYKALENKLKAQVSPPVQQTNQLPSGVTQQQIDQVYNEIKNTPDFIPSDGPFLTMEKPKVPSGVTQQEFNWSLLLKQKVKNENYQPTAQEAYVHQNIMNKINGVNTAQPTQPVLPFSPAPTQQVVSSSSAPSQEELQWALQMEEKVKQGYKPTDQDTATYQAIFQKLAASQQASANASTPAVKPVSQEEIQWALELEAKAKQGYQPTPEETSKYQDMAHRLQAQKQAAQNPQASQAQSNRDWSAWSQPFTVPRSLFETTPRIIQVPATLRSSVPSLPTHTAYNQGPTLQTQTASTGPVSKAEIDWALSLEDKVKKGYSPNQGEIAQYKSIFEKMQNSKGATTTQPVSQPQQPTQSTSLGNRVKNAWAALTAG